MQSSAVLPQTDAIIEVRERCPVCDADAPVTLLSEPFDSASITAFLVRQYAGRANLEQLQATKDGARIAFGGPMHDGSQYRCVFLLQPRGTYQKVASC